MLHTVSTLFSCDAEFGIGQIQHTGKIFTNQRSAAVNSTSDLKVGTVVAVSTADIADDRIGNIQGRNFAFAESIL